MWGFSFLFSWSPSSPHPSLRVSVDPCWRPSLACTVSLSRKGQDFVPCLSFPRLETDGMAHASRLALCLRQNSWVFLPLCREDSQRWKAAAPHYRFGRPAPGQPLFLAFTYFSRIVFASISAFSSPGTSNLFVKVRETSVLASISLLGSFTLPHPSPARERACLLSVQSSTGETAAYKRHL